MSKPIGKDPRELFYPSKDIVCTESFSQFIFEYKENFDFFFFVIHIVGAADEMRIRASRALIPTAKSHEDRERYERLSKEEDLTLKQLQSHSKILSQNLTNGAVNAFQRYFSAIIQSAAKRNPLIISSSQSIRIDDILKFRKHKDLINFIIDRKINDLSYGGIYEMEKYFDERLGIKMFQNERQRSLLKLFIEARNINTHNGGIVNDIFLKKVGSVDGFSFSNGKRFHIDMDEMIILCENAMSVATYIDDEVGNKFRLKKKKYDCWRPIKTKS